MVKIAQNKPPKFFDGSLAAETQHRTIPCDDGDDNDDAFYRRKGVKERGLERGFFSLESIIDFRVRLSLPNI